MAHAEMEETKVPFSAGSPAELMQSFVARFGSVRTSVVRSRGREVLAIFHDKASGVVQEDLYLYRRVEDRWLLVAYAAGSNIRAEKLEIRGAQAMIVSRTDKILLATLLR